MLCGAQVSDMLDPEYYLGAFRGADGRWITTKFSDGAVMAQVADTDAKARCRFTASRLIHTGCHLLAAQTISRPICSALALEH